MEAQRVRYQSRVMPVAVVWQMVDAGAMKSPENWEDLKRLDPATPVKVTAPVMTWTRVQKEGFAV